MGSYGLLINSMNEPTTWSFFQSRQPSHPWNPARPWRGIENPHHGPPTTGGHHGVRRRSTQPDPDWEKQEWRDSIQAVAQQWGEGECTLVCFTPRLNPLAGVDIEVVETPYLNTIHPDDQGVRDLAMEDRLHGIIRCDDDGPEANKYFEGIGGHISTYASASHAWEMGFNHFFRGKDGEGSGDHLYWQRWCLRPCVAGRAPPTNTLKNSVKKSAERAFPVILILV